MEKFYVYIHLNPNNNEIFYVGKGCGNRKSSKNRNDKWLKYVSELNGDFKTLVLKENLSEKESLELERKVLTKVDYHYDDITTNIENSEIFGITIGFELDKNSSSNFRFKNSTDEEIIETLLSFPNETEFSKIEEEFEKLYNEFHDNYDELEEVDEDVFIEIEGIIDFIFNMIEEYKVSDGDDMSEFILDLRREKEDLEFILEEKPKKPQRKIVEKLCFWIESKV